MASIRAKIAAATELATADDVDGTTDNTQVLDLAGAAGAVIVQINNGTAGTAGIDVIEFSRDGGTTWNAATAAKIGNGHKGLLKGSDRTAVTNAALNAAGAEPSGAAVFVLGATDGPFLIRCGRKTTDTNGTTWVTGAPTVNAYRVG